MDRLLSRRGFILGASALAALPLLDGCTARRDTARQGSAPSKGSLVGEEISALASEASSLLVWSTYWDGTGDSSIISRHARQISAASLFAASFSDGELVVPDALPRTMRRIRADEGLEDATVFLSVVNDVERDGKTVQKDTEILRTLFETDASCARHARELVKLARDGGYDGIEVDYEKIRKDTALWERFLVFERALIERAGDAGLRVRVVLEPSTPVDEVGFLDGAEYSVMCYNLCGVGTEAGPKADCAFLDEMAGRFGGLPGVSFALANGGYSWKAGTTEAAQVTRAEAERLIRQNKAKPFRDDASGALSFACRVDGESREIWYADERTLALWAKRLARALGAKADICLWRL